MQSCIDLYAKKFILDPDYARCMHLFSHYLNLIQWKILSLKLLFHIHCAEFHYCGRNSTVFILKWLTTEFQSYHSPSIFHCNSYCSDANSGKSKLLNYRTCNESNFRMVSENGNLTSWRSDDRTACIALHCIPRISVCIMSFANEASKKGTMTMI